MRRFCALALAALVVLGGWHAAVAARPAAAAPATAEAKQPVVLNLQVRLDGAVVKVGDLWRNTGANAATVIGPAPPPGRSIVIEAAQLGYIARLYGVEWQPPVSAPSWCRLWRFPW
jgi:hypothetical protein